MSKQKRKIATASKRSVANGLDRSKPPRPSTGGKINFPKYFEKRLPNGFKLFVVENHSLPIVTMGFVARGGSTHDGGLPGLASMTAELLTKGTRRRTATQIAEEIDFVGGSISTSATWDSCQVFVSVLKDNQSTGFDLLQDLVMDPVFPDEEIDRVKTQRLASIMQLKADSDYLADVRFSRSVFGDHPFGRPAGGTEDSVRTITRKDISDYHRSLFTPDNSFMVFAGDIGLAEAMRLISKSFRKWKGKTTAPTVLAPTPVEGGPRVFIVDKADAVQSAVRIGHFGVARRSPDFLKIFVMNTLLGGYFSSRINMNLREAHGYTYGGRSSFEARMLAGLFEVSADVRNEVTGETIDEVFVELKRIRETLPSRDELAMVKNYLTGLFPIQLETPQQVAGRVITVELYQLPKNYYRNYRNNIRRVTARDIRSVARKYIDPEKVIITLCGNAKEISSKLKKFGQIRIFDSNDKTMSS